jgi:hypothetical protein
VTTLPTKTTALIAKLNPATKPIKVHNTVFIWRSACSKARKTLELSQAQARRIRLLEDRSKLDLVGPQ